MTNTCNEVPVSDDLRELTEVFRRQLAQVRSRLAVVRRNRGSAAAFEVDVLLQHEVAWQVGIVLMREARGTGVSGVIRVLTAAGQHRRPMSDIFAVMATMIAIRQLWTTVEERVPACA